MWSLRKLFNIRLGTSRQTIIDRTVIVTFLTKNASNGKLFGLFCAKAPAMMHVTVDRIISGPDGSCQTIVFNWFEPTGELLSSLTISLDDILAISPFDDSNWAIPRTLYNYFTTLITQKIPTVLLPI